MNLPRIFRRTRPAPKPRLDPHEARVISAWGFTEQEWHELNNPARAYFRSNYTKADGYTA
jgi:hypothetical protein